MESFEITLDFELGEKWQKIIGYFVLYDKSFGDGHYGDGHYIEGYFDQTPRRYFFGRYDETETKMEFWLLPTPTPSTNILDSTLFFIFPNSTNSTNSANGIWHNYSSIILYYFNNQPPKGKAQIRVVPNQKNPMSIVGSYFLFLVNNPKIEFSNLLQEIGPQEKKCWFLIGGLEHRQSLA